MTTPGAKSMSDKEKAEWKANVLNAYSCGCIRTIETFRPCNQHDGAWEKAVDKFVASYREALKDLEKP